MEGIGVGVGVDVGVAAGVGGTVGAGVGVGNRVAVGVDVGVKVGEGVGTGVNVATVGTGDGDAATTRSVATPPDLRAVQPARHRSGSRTASSSQPRRGRKAAVGWGTGMARCAVSGGCGDNPGLYAAGLDRTARTVAGSSRSCLANGRLRDHGFRLGLNLPSGTWR